MALIMINDSRLLEMKVIAKSVRHRVLVAYEMNRFTVWNKHFTRYEARFKEVISDEVPLWSVEIDNKVG